MAAAAVVRPSPTPSTAGSGGRASSPSPSLRASSPPTPSRRASASPAPHHSPRAPRRSSFDKETVGGSFYSVMETAKHKILENGHGPLNGHANGSAHDETTTGSRRRESSASASEDDVDASLRRRSVPRSPRAIPRSPPPPGVATLPTIVAHVEMDTASIMSDDGAHSPPPAPSAILAHSSEAPPTGVRRRRRSSSIKVKPPPGVTPTKAVDWEIPRKVFHSSIGFVTLALWWSDPPTVGPLIKYLSAALTFISICDVFRLRYPAFAELWEVFVGFLMREEERNKVNGVIWYLVGVIFVLALYPRDVAVVSILTLSWSDTTASTIGRLWGRYTPPLPPHFPGLKFLPFAPRKSLAGFLAATVTGSLISIGFWHRGSDLWQILNLGVFGQALTAIVVGLGGAVVEALDIGLDDNLTLPILSGALIWAWFSFTNLVLGH